MSDAFITKDALLAERRRYFVAARGGLSLPVAGAIYWIIIGFLGYRLELEQWALTAAMLTGAIFPIGFILQYPLKAHFMKAKSAVSGVAMMAIIAINLLWPVHVVIISIAPAAAAFTLAIGMTLHWPVIGWSYASLVCQIHAAARIAVVSWIFFAMPDARMTALPFAVAALYLLAALGLAVEVELTRRRIAPRLQPAYA